MHVARPLALLASSVLLVSSLLACVLLAAPAHADDEPSAVSRLSPEEIAYLEKRFPEWSKLDPRRQEHVARNVLRLREMSEEDREKLKERMQRLRGRGRGKGGRDRSRSGGFRAISAIGSRLVERLPAAGKAEVERVDGRPSGVKMTLFHLVRGKVAETEGFEYSPEELAALPESLRGKVERMLVQARDESDARRAAGARTKLSQMRAFRKIEVIRKELGTDATDVQFADAVMNTWASEIDAVMGEIEAEPKRFGEMLVRKMRYSKSPQDHARSVRWLEQVALRKWRRDPGARAAADQVVRRLLVDELGVDPKAVENLPGYDQPRERMRALEKLLGKSRVGRGWGRGSPRSGQRDGGRRRAGGRVPRGQGDGNGAPRRGPGRRPGSDEGK